MNARKPVNVYAIIIDKSSDALPMTGRRSRVKQRPKQSEPTQPRRRGRPSKQSLSLDTHRLLRKEQQRELNEERKAYGLEVFFYR